MADKVTLSLSADTLARARDAAKREGMTLSAWIDRAARRAALRDAAQRHREWLDANPDVRQELESFRSFARRNRQDWSALGEPA